MPRPSKRKQYTEKANRIIYVILNPSTKEFYISYTLAGKENIRVIYKDHYTEKRNKTMHMIHQMKLKNVHPCFFKLDTVFCTKVEAYRVVIAWTKIFIEHGYINLDQGNISEYIKDLFGEAKTIYESKKNIDIDYEFNCNNCLFPTYRRQKCEMKARDTNATN